MPRLFASAEPSALLIERAGESRSTLTAALTELGVRSVNPVRTVRDAQDMLKHRTFDVVLCELDLGQGLDGLYLFELAQRMHWLLPSTVFMLVSGERRAAQITGVAELAPDGYVLKPFAVGVLIRRLEQALRRKLPLHRLDASVRKGDLLTAIAECDRVLETDAYHPDFARLKGRFLLQLGEYAKARDFFRAQLADGNSAWALLGLGQALFALEQFADARVCFEQAVSLYPLLLAACDWLSRTLMAQGEFGAAQTILAAAVARSPLLLDRQNELGQLAHRNGDLLTAENALTRTVELGRLASRSDAGVYGQLARVQLARGDIGAARGTARQLRQHLPGQAPAQVVEQLIESSTLDASERHRSQQLLTEACQTLDKIDMPSGSVLIEAAHACFNQQRAEDGDRYVRHALRNGHDHLLLRQQVDTLYHAQGDEEKARAMISAASQDVAQLNNEAVAKLKAGDLQGAVACFVDALETLSGNVQVLLNAVNAILALVNNEGWHVEYMLRAQTYLARIERLDPGNVRARQMMELYRRTQRRYGVDVVL
ncbi:tetratricopeptide repeat protein [Chitinibacteraceae bacterium HSL-7]